MSMQSDFRDSLKKAFKGLKKKTRKIPKQADDLREVLLLLKQREKVLQHKLNHERDSVKAQRIRNEIEIIHCQREKGLRLLRGVNDGEALPPL